MIFVFLLQIYMSSMNVGSKYLLVATVGTDVDADSHLPKNIYPFKNLMLCM